MTATLENVTRRIPDTKPDKLHISYSQVKSYCMCSLKWYCSRNFEAESVSSALVFGKAWHAAVEMFYQRHMQGETVSQPGSGTASQLHAMFITEYEKETKPICYGKSEDKDSLLEKAGQMLTVFCEQVKPGRVVAIEEEVRCQLAHEIPELLGYIDLVEIETNEQGQDELVLVDFKTAARKPDSPDYNQLILYALAAHRTGLAQQYNLPLSLRFDYITKTRNPEYLQFRFKPDHSQACLLAWDEFRCYLSKPRLAVQWLRL